MIILRNPQKSQCRPRTSLIEVNQGLPSDDSRVRGISKLDLVICDFGLSGLRV